MGESREQIIARAAEALGRAAKPPRLVVLFGSWARGAAHGESDVDLAFLAGEELTLAEELALEAELSHALGREVDLVSLDTEDTMLRWRVARDGVVVRAVPAVEASRFFAQAAIEHDDMQPLMEDAAARFAKHLEVGRR